MKEHFYGCLPSPPDERDYKAKEYVTMGVRPQEHIPKEFAPILNQGQVGSCVAHSIATMKWYQEHDESMSYEQFSTDFVYHNRLDTDWQGSGMMMREAASHVIKDGLCYYKSLPTNTEYPNATTKVFVESLKDKAKECKTLRYVYCNDLEELANCIWQYKGAILSINVKLSFDSFFLKDEKSWVLPIPKDNEKSYGYHCVCACGYNKDGIIIQNSWGDVWGCNGFAVLPWDYPTKEIIAFVDERKDWDIIELKIGSKVGLVNNREIYLDAPAKIKNSRTYVPLRFIGEALGAEVEWDYNTRSITIKDKNNVIETMIDKNFACVNGEVLSLEDIPFIEKGRTYVPLRFIGETLGCNVEWVSNERKVVIRRQK